MPLGDFEVRFPLFYAPSELLVSTLSVIQDLLVYKLSNLVLAHCLCVVSVSESCCGTLIKRQCCHEHCQKYRGNISGCEKCTAVNVNRSKKCVE